MQKTIRDIQSQIEFGEIKTIDQIKLNIVYRLIQVLGWDLWDPAEVQCHSAHLSLKTNDMVFLNYRGSHLVTIVIEDQYDTKEGIFDNNRIRIVRLFNQTAIQILILVSIDYWVFYANLPIKSLVKREAASFSFKQSTPMMIKNILLTLLSRYQVCCGNALLYAARMDEISTRNQPCDTDEDHLESKYISYVCTMNALYQTMTEEQEHDFIDKYMKQFELCSPEQHTYQAMFKECVREMLEYLNPKERIIVILRFGLSNQKVHTLEEISRVTGKSRERIRQIVNKIMDKLLFFPRLDDMAIYYQYGYPKE